MLEEPRMYEQEEIHTNLIGALVALDEASAHLRAGMWTAERVRQSRELLSQVCVSVKRALDAVRQLPQRASDGTSVWEDPEAAVTNDPQETYGLEDVAKNHGSFLTGLEMAASRCGAGPRTSRVVGEGRPTADRTSETFRTQVVTERPEVGSVTYLRRETATETARREQRQKEERARLAKLRKPSVRRRKWTGRR